MQTPFQKVQAHLESILPDTLTDGFRLYGGIRSNHDRAEVVTENSKAGTVFEVVVCCRVSKTEDGDFLTSFSEVK